MAVDRIDDFMAAIGQQHFELPNQVRSAMLDALDLDGKRLNAEINRQAMEHYHKGDRIVWQHPDTNVAYLGFVLGVYADGMDVQTDCPVPLRDSEGREFRHSQAGGFTTLHLGGEQLMQVRKFVESNS